MNCGIYKLIWKEQGYFYYGQTNNFEKRKGQHFRAFKNGYHYNIKMQRIFNKYGFPDFEIVESCENSQLNDIEQKYLNEHFNNILCCNMSPKANGVRGIKRSLETRERIRQRKIGTTQSDEQKEKARQRMLKRYADGWKLPSMKGKKNGFYKKKHDLITKIIMSQKKQGVYDGSKNPKARLILNLETGIFYGTINEAANSVNHYSIISIRKQIEGQNKNKTSFVYA